jgi:hypothetical protein
VRTPYTVSFPAIFAFSFMKRLPHMLVFPQISRTVFVDGENICGRYP